MDLSGVCPVIVQKAPVRTFDQAALRFNGLHLPFRFDFYSDQMRLDLPKLEPKPGILGRRIFATGLSLWRKRKEKITSYQIEGELDKLKQAVSRKDRVILALNHAGGGEHVFLPLLESVVGKPIVTISQAGVFDSIKWDAKPAWQKKLNQLSWRLMKKMGLYPVNAEINDRPAKQILLDTIESGKYVQTIFPEDHITNENDMVAPFAPGMVVYGLRALSNLRKKGAQADVLTVPVAIRYQYTNQQEALRALQFKVIIKLENRFELFDEWVRSSFVEKRDFLSLVRRTKVLWGRAIDETMKTYFPNQPLFPKTTLDKVAQHHLKLMDALIVDVEQDLQNRIGYQISSSASFEERIVQARRAIRSHFKQVANRYDTFYQSRLDTAYLLHKFSVNYLDVPAQVTTERLVETAFKIHKLVYNTEFSLKDIGPRSATLSVGEPISLTPWLKDFESGSREAADKANQTVRERMQDLLNQSGRSVKKTYSVN